MTYEEAQLAEQRHQYLDLDADSKHPVPTWESSAQRQARVQWRHNKLFSNGGRS